MLVFQALPGLFHVLRATRRKGKAPSDAAEGGATSPEGEGETSLRERAEERGNPYHDPSNGQFTTGGGGGAAAGNPSLTGEASGGTLQSSSRPNWSKEEQKRPFDYYEMQPDKTGYPRHLRPTGFSSETTLDKHFKDHGKGIGATDRQSYFDKAKEFFVSERGENGDAFVRKNGDACRYDYGSHEFMAVTKTGTIKTFWNLLDSKTPAGADEYWEDQKMRG